MVLSRFALNLCPILIEIGLFLFPIIGFFFIGALPSRVFSFMLGVIGLIGTFMACALISCGLLLLIEIRNSLKK